MQFKSQQHHTYPLDAWRICETNFDESSANLAETLFALGNGTIGLRGTHEEAYLGAPGTSQEGNYLNGFYETEAIHYPEAAYGLAKNNQFMLNVPNAKRMQLWLDDECFNLSQGSVSAYERSLNFQTGILTRKLQWQSPKGQQIQLTSERIVCFERKHLFAIRYCVTSINFTGRVTITSAIDGNVKNLSASDDPRVGSTMSAAPLQLLTAIHEQDYVALIQRTNNSGFELVSAMANKVGAEWQILNQHPYKNSPAPDYIEQHFCTHISPGLTVTLSKFGCYFSSRDSLASELQPQSRACLIQAQASGFDELCREQKKYLDDFWLQADVEIAGDQALQQGIHFNQFHLLQSVGRDGKTNIAAKGVTGEGYEGHYFWDTEIYVLPFFLYNKPEIAKQLLQFRFHGLDQARQRAREMSHAQGALYPWRTIGGEECSAYYPAGTAQYHINADIAYAIKSYLEVTHDDDFLIQCGAEMVLETARIWIDLGGFSPNNPERFCINEVTGPDEYTALVNNNYYTNLMAQMHMQFAHDIAHKLMLQFPEEYQRISTAIGLHEDELLAWENAVRHMYLPKDSKLGIHAQDDSFLSKKVWDFAATPKENYPLLLHYHPLVIYRHQVCKQADLMLAMLLLSDKFSDVEKKNNFDYYERITTHDSSLSSCIFSIIAAEIGYHDKAYRYFMQTARMDLDNTQGNTGHGVHTAAMAGTWMGVTYGFAGMRVVNGKLSFKPGLPQQWTHYRFQVQLHGAMLQVRVSRDNVSYHLLRGERLELHHQDQLIELTQQHPAQQCNLHVMEPA